MRVDPDRARRFVAAAVVLAALLRLGFALGYWTGKPLTHDEREYLALAGSLAAGRGLVYDGGMDVGTGQQFGRAPGYPVFLAAIGAPASAPAAPRRVQAAQAVVGALGVLVIALLAWRTAGPGAGVAASAIAAIYPPLVVLPAYVLSEALFSTLALATALWLQREMDRPGGLPTPGIVVAGLLCGVCALVRPSMIFFVPCAALWVFWRRGPAAAAALALTTALVIAPWTIRNYRVYHRLIPIASEGGITFWTGNHPLAIGEGDLAANPELKRAELAFRQAHPGLSPEEMEPLYYRDALRTIRERPLWWAGLVARKAFYLVVPIGPSYALHSPKYRLASTVPYLLLVPFAAAGLRRILQGARPPAALLLLSGSAVLVCLIFFPQERFRIPVLDPTLIVCASGLAARSSR
jgi:4-amino-4-deoxy-L-arabinose transferase-like glycosyltransferase